MMQLRRARPMLGTLVEIRVDSGRDCAEAQKAIQYAFDAVTRIQVLMSYHDPTSEVSRINREAFSRTVTVSEPTWRVLTAARHISEQSKGLFDITVAPTLRRHGFLPQHPGHPTVSVDADWRDILLLPGNQVRLSRPVHIDLGGIAKGYAVDRAVMVLQEHGIESGCVNAGGDMRIFGSNPQILHVRHPRHATSLIAAGRIERAAATSAVYFSSRMVDSQRVTPLVDPRNHKPCSDERSVTILADDCMTADALTKVFYIDPAAGGKLLTRFNARALLLEADPDSDNCRIFDSTEIIQDTRSNPGGLWHV